MRSLFVGGLLASCLGATSSAPAAEPQIPAFPGAQGFGAFAAGGRGGDVYHVTTLADGGPGSLRLGVKKPRGPRTIVFEVGGTIDLRSPLTIDKVRGLTIAGQTAPGGITLRGYPLEIVRSGDVVVRYLRVRPGDRHARRARGRPSQGNGNLSANDAHALALGITSRVVVDHVSLAWGMDETLSVTKSRDVTVQNSIIAESLHDSFHPKGPHGYGSLVRGHGGGVTLLGNLYAHHAMRSPGIGGRPDPEKGKTRPDVDLDFVNNVVYDWGRVAGHTLHGSGDVRLHYRGNVLVAGPSTTCRDCIFVHREDPEDDQSLAIHAADNWVDADADARLDPHPVKVGGFKNEPRLAEAPFAFARPALEVAPAMEAYRRVLYGAGASRPRDAVDQRIVAQVRARSGRIVDAPPPSAPALPAVAAGTPAPDADRDGIDDDWEIARGLDPSDPADRNARTLSPPYTDLEVYLQELAGDRR